MPLININFQVFDNAFILFYPKNILLMWDLSFVKLIKTVKNI
jgi:hypothetical protein